MRPSTLFRVVLSGTAWSFLGVALAVGFFYWREYRERFDVKIIVEDEVSLVEVRERIPDLRILYRDQDLLNTGQQIRLLTVTLRNDGETILQQYYDLKQPFGIEFTNSKILSIGDVRSNSEYLQQNVLPEERRKSYELRVSSEDTGSAESSLDREGELHLEKVIIEEDKFWTAQLYLLQPVSDEPTRLRPLGKIANVESIPVLYKEETKTSTAKKGTKFAYFGLGYLGLFILAIGLLSVTHFVEKRKKNKKLTRFLVEHPQLTQRQRHIMNTYRHHWNVTLDRLMRMLLEGNEVIDLSDFFTERQKRYERNPIFLILRLPTMLSPLTHLTIPLEIFSRRDRQIFLNEENRSFLEEFFRQMLGVGLEEQALPGNAKGSGE